MSKTRREPGTEFGRYLRKLMDANGFHTNAELARRADMNESSLSKWQSGTSAPDIDGLRKIAPHLGVRLVDLLVRADILTPDELAMAGEPAPAPEPPPPAIGRIIHALTAPDTPKPERDRLLRLVDDALTYWERSGIEAPREPAAAQRTARKRATGSKR